MPLNGGGTASRVPGTSAAPNQTIKSADYNAEMDDVYSILNTARPIAYGGTGATTAVGGADALSTKGADIASASTTDLSTATGDYVTITGTTTITSLGTAAAGVERTVRFAGALILTHNATSLILPGGANITTAAGDTAVFRSESSGNWRCIIYQRASTVPVRPQAWEQIGPAINLAGASSTPWTDLSGYRMLRLRVDGRPSLTGLPFIRYSSDNGSTWDSGASDYKSTFLYTLASAPSTPTGSSVSRSDIPLGISNWLSTQYGTASIEMQWFNTPATTLHTVHISQITATGGVDVGFNKGYRDAATGTNALLLSPGAGATWSAGYAILEGLRG